VPDARRSRTGSARGPMPVADRKIRRASPRRMRSATGAAATKPGVPRPGRTMVVSESHTERKGSLMRLGVVSISAKYTAGRKPAVEPIARTSAAAWTDAIQRTALIAAPELSGIGTRRNCCAQTQGPSETSPFVLHESTELPVTPGFSTPTDSTTVIGSMCRNRTGAERSRTASDRISDQTC
jgi:hypothetical protein